MKQPEENGGEPTMKHIYDNIWRGLVSPRVEMLVWFALTGELNTRDKLLRRGVIRQGEQACVMCNHEEETWTQVKSKEPKANNRIDIRCGQEKPTWWNCYYSDCMANKYTIGGYLEIGSGKIMCWMGEDIEKGHDGDLHLKGPENAIQFLLEEANLDNEDIKIVSIRRDIVDWINGKDDTCWDQRFLRNKTKNMSKIFVGVEVVHKEVKEFKVREQWEEHAKSKAGRWVYWEPGNNNGIDK
ncbi:hypothetical protein PIB30_013118 [Stylosanthes scabra]|uniref:Reverse transcriptase zinc-binding domain-containing protein n=1 Tax=Stylosanthes scabra TaxID=79078 RepID=A0ABU6W838_9FABA|nr:hypothetical protein [Stylosanthes scabra]